MQCRQQSPYRMIRFRQNPPWRHLLAKKIASDVDNPSAREAKRCQLIHQMQFFLTEGCSHREVARRLGISTKTMRKFKSGKPEEMCRTGIHQSKLDVYRETVHKCLDGGISKGQAVKQAVCPSAICKDTYGSDEIQDRFKRQKGGLSYKGRNIALPVDG